MATTKILKIMLWGREVGRLSIDARRHLPYFEFNPQWIDSGLDISPLDISIKQPQILRPILGNTEKKIYHNLPPFLADSLPDAWGNELFEKWRQQQGLKLGDITPLDKLAFIGKRAMGALEFQPETAEAQSNESINLQALIDLANQIYSQREIAHIDSSQSLTMQTLMAVGTSAGGRMPKAIIAINWETGDIRSGQINDLKGYDYYIVKFGIKGRSTAELEMAYHEMAFEAGIDMMPCWLMEIDGENHFVTKRFDRKGERKLHIQTLAALCPEADSYERLLWVCRKMRLPEYESEEIFRRMVFNILANNTDDHVKNFSFIMDERGRWSLSPAYDLTYIFDNGGYLPERHHCLMIRGKYTDITLDDVMALAAENGIRKAKDIIRQVTNAVRNFRNFASKFGAQECWISAIEQTINENLKSWGLKESDKTNFIIDGHKIKDFHIEQQFRGNYILTAKIDGKNMKYIIRKGTPEHDEITKIGLADISSLINFCFSKNHIVSLQKIMQ